MTPRKALCLVMACYDQPKMMAKQVETWASYSDKVKTNLKVVVVDDAGPEHPFTLPDSPVDLSVYRVTKDIPWNQMGARNLGMQVTREGWSLMIDPDMIVKPEIMEVLVSRAMQPPNRRARYRLLLRHMRTGGFDDTCPNVYMIHTSDFWSAKGYDEDYAGHKGYSDVMLHFTLSTIGVKSVFWRDCHVDFYATEHIEDAAVMKLDRDYRHNRALHLRKQAIAKKIGIRRYLGQIGQPCRFEWEQVQ